MSQSARPDDFVSWIVDLAAAIGKLDPEQKDLLEDQIRQDWGVTPHTSPAPAGATSQSATPQCWPSWPAESPCVPWRANFAWASERCIASATPRGRESFRFYLKREQPHN